MAITLRGTAGNNGSDNADLTITLPAGVAENDVCYVAFSSAVSADVDLTMTTTGYSELADLYANDTTDSCLGVFRKKQGATPDSTAICTESGAESGTTGIAGVVTVLIGVDTTTQEDAATTTATAIDSGTPDPPAIVTATAGAWVLAIGSSSEADAVSNAPTNYTNLIDQQTALTNNTNIMMSTREISSPTTENPGTYADIAGNTLDSWCAATVAVRPAGGGPTTYEGAITVALSEGITAAGVFSAQPSVAFGVSTGLTELGNLDVQPALSLGDVLGLTAQGGLAFDGTITLAVSDGLSAATRLDAVGTTTFGITDDFSVSPAGSTFNVTLTLPEASGLGVGGLIDASPSLAFGTSVGLVLVGGLNLDSALSIGATAGLSDAAVLVIGASLGFGAQLAVLDAGAVTLDLAAAFGATPGLSLSGALDMSPALTLGIVDALAAAGLLDAGAAVGLGGAVGLVLVGGLNLDSSVTLGAGLGVGTGVALSVEAGGAFGVTLVLASAELLAAALEQPALIVLLDAFAIGVELGAPKATADIALDLSVEKT